MKNGLYQMTYKGQREVVDVHPTLQGQWPDKREIEMAHFLSGGPRFPISTEELKEWGAEFNFIK